jgi:hypothetical protein
VEATGVEFNAMKIADNTEITNANRAGVEPLNEAVEEIKPCWTKPSPSNNIYYIILPRSFSLHPYLSPIILVTHTLHSAENDLSNGFVTLSLTLGPEYHISQVLPVA